MENKVRTKEELRQIKELMLQRARIQQARRQFEHENKIEFFGIVDEQLAKIHKDCCKLFRGMNPMQLKLIEAWENLTYKVFTFTGANRIGKCLTYQTPISTPDGEISIGELFKIGKPFDVYAWDGEKKVVARASAPFKKPGLHECYRIEMSDGRFIEAADRHRILTTSGAYTTVDELLGIVPAQRWSSLAYSRSAHILSGRRWFERLLNCLDRCFGGFRQYDGQLLNEIGTGQVSVPSQDGVQQQYRSPLHTEDNKIIRHNSIGRQEVYDFSVDKYHNYFAGGMIHHNTTVGAVIGLSVLFGKWLWNGKPIKFSHGHPRKVRYIGQDWEKHIKAVVEPELRKWWPKNRKVGNKKNNFGIDALWIDEATGSLLEIMSNNQESDLHEGWSGDLIIYDEPPKRDIRVANARGLVDRCGRELFCMTLLKEAWVDREVIRAMNEDGSPDQSVYNIHGDIAVNIGYGLTQEGVDQFAKTLKPEEKEARLKGKPSYMSGLVYPQFDRKIHLKKPLKNIPLDWVVDIGIDFHPSKPWAVLFVATDRHNFKWVIDEIWQNGSYKAIGEEIIRRIKKHNLRVGKIIIDPLSKGDENSDLNEESVYEKMGQIFMKYGYVLYTASKDKEGGINLTQDLLMTENEMPALFFFDNLKRTIYEIEGYMTDPKTLKPSKEDDDMMENLYRIVLLNTQWYEQDFRDEDDMVQNLKRNVITGY